MRRAIIVLAADPALAQKRTIQETDLFDFKWIADPQISSGGSRVAFVKVTVNDKKDGYSTSIWTVSPGATCRLAAVCWATRTPLSAPTRVRMAPGNCSR